jgi:hypothetical protein
MSRREEMKEKKKAFLEGKRADGQHLVARGGAAR